MPDLTTFRDDFRRYADLLLPAVSQRYAFSPTMEDALALQVERGTVFAHALMDPAAPRPAPVDRLIALANDRLTSDDRLARIAVVDAAGHRRPAYRPLLIYACLQAFGVWYEALPPGPFGRWEESLRAWCGQLEAGLGDMIWPTDTFLAARGADAAEAAWNALALHVAGRLFVRDAWTDLAADAFGRLGRLQQPSGSLLRVSPSDNPETHWYHELVTLHAIASYAAQSETRPLAGVVRRATEFHLNETQPDHASNQPWAAFAFLWNPATRPLADQLLHAASVQHPSGAGGVTLMLLSDCLYCLRLFLNP